MWRGDGTQSYHACICQRSPAETNPVLLRPTQSNTLAADSKYHARGVCLQARELNPYLRAGGAGAEGGEPVQPLHRAGGVGDGGASWRMKALKRAQAQAKEEVCGVK